MPDWVAYVRRRLPRLPCRPEREVEIVEELADQLSDLYDAARARGASEPEAMARVEAEVPDWNALADDLLRSEHPASAPFRRSSLFDVTADLRHALRALRSTPLFTTVGILMVALGIGATSAVFSLINGVLLKPLPFHDPSRLAIVQTMVPQIRDRYPVLPANARAFAAWRAHCRTTCEQLGALGPVQQALTGNGEPEGLTGARVSANVFNLLGVPPHIGRTFVPGDEVPGRNSVVVLSHALWQRRFGSDPGIVGRNIMLGGRAHEVIGVLSPRAQMPRMEHLYSIRSQSGQPAYFTPLTFTADEQKSEGDFDYVVILRLREAATPAQAVAELTPITAAAFRDTALNPQPLVRRLDDQLVSGVRRSLWLVLGAVVAAFVVACVNLANLLTARWLGRRRELAIRTAMGAGRGELARHVVVETLCLAVAGGLLGLPVAYALVRGLLVLAPLDIPRLEEVALDGGVLAFATVLMLVCSIVCGLVPVWRVLRTDTAGVLRASAHTTTDTAAWSRLRSTLVGGEAGVTTALLMMAGLLLASFVRVMTVDPGFLPDRRAAVDFRLPGTRYAEMNDRVRFVERLLDATRAMSSIESAAITQKLPLEGEATVDSFLTDASAEPRVSLQSVGNHHFVSPDYFTTMGIRVLAGRAFADADRGRGVALVSEYTARTLWPGREAIGQSFWRSNRRNRWEVIGVVADTYPVGLDHPTGLAAYVPYWERTAPNVSLVVRSRADFDTVAGELREAVHRIDPELPLVGVRTLDVVVERAVAARRFQLLLTLTFAAAGLVIACLGIYGVVASAVQRRRAELAIRLALGGTPREIVLLIAGQGFRPVMWGLVAGTLVAVAGGQAIRALLFNVSPMEPVVVVSVALLVLVVAALACLEPSLRAARTSPLAALRE